MSVELNVVASNAAADLTADQPTFMIYIWRRRYKQMIGRAGRAGFATTGKSYLLCDERELPMVKDMLRGELPEVRGALLYCRLPSCY